MRAAAIDCGTNSTRLLVGDVEGGRLTTLVREMTITRLGEGVGTTGTLAPAAMERVGNALRRYRTILDSHGVSPDHVVMTATSAARDATNRDDFFAAAEAVVGVRPRLLTGEDEGRLSWLGATAELPEMDGDGPLLVVDIGGGSTEFCVGEPGSPAPADVRSVDVGCVRVTEQFLHHDPPTAVELSQAVNVVRDHLDDVVREVPEVLLARRMVGLAGTVSTVAAVEIGLPVYDRDRIHHFVLTRDAAEDVFRTLATESREDRLGNPGLEEGRADVIVGGCIVLVSVLRHLALDSLLVSEADILDGLVLDHVR